MKITIEDASALPEALQALVADNELDLTTLAPASEVEKFKAQKLKAEGEAIDRRKELQDWKKLGETPDSVREAMEAKGKGSDEEHEAIVAKIKADHEAEVGELKGMLTQTHKRQAMSDLKASLAEAGVIPEGLDILSAYAANRLTYEDDGTPKIMTADGSAPMVGNAPNGGATMGDLAKELAGTIPHLVKDAGKGGGGKPAGDGGGKPAKHYLADAVPGFSDLPEK